MIRYPPEVAELLARGAEVAWCPLVDNSDAVVGAVILGVCWPLGWDAPQFRHPESGRDTLVPNRGQCIPRRRDSGPCVLPRPGPAVLRT